MTDLRIVTDAGRLAEISRLFDSGPDLIPVRDIGWLIDVAREIAELRAEIEEQIKIQVELEHQVTEAEDLWQEAKAENERLRAALQTVRDHYAVHAVGGLTCCLTCDQIAQSGLE
jgi:chromosome segregation ATPase